MSTWVFLKMFGDACLYFSAVSALKALFPHTFSFYLPALLCGLGPATAAFVTRRWNEERRYWCIALPLLSLLLVGSVMDVLILIPILAYAIAVIIRCDFYLEYYDFRESFLRTLRVWCIAFCVIAVFHGLETQAEPDKAVLETTGALYYGLLFMLSGVILSRMLRLGHTGGKRWTKGQAAVAVGLGGGVLAAMIVLEKLLQNMASSLGDVLLSFLMLLLGLPGQLLNKFLNWVISLVDKGYLEYAQAKQQEIREISSGSVLPTEAAGEKAAETANAFPWWLAVLILAALAVLLVWMLKQLRAGAVVSRGEGSVEKLEQPQRKSRTSRRTNRAKVRHYYRQFLRLEKKKGAALRSNQTSEDILSSVSPEADTASAAQLREIYLAARYDESRDISREQAEYAGAALKRYRDSVK